jgi:hypothetical protein
MLWFIWNPDLNPLVMFREIGQWDDDDIIEYMMWKIGKLPCPKYSPCGLTYRLVVRQFCNRDLQFPTTKNEAK